MRKNLYDETISEMNDYLKKPEDVRYVVLNEEYFCNFSDFALAARQINYDAGYGWPLITDGCMIVGDGWWLERHEYDGSEWWEFKTIPHKPDKVMWEAKKIISAIYNDF